MSAPGPERPDAGAGYDAFDRLCRRPRPARCIGTRIAELVERDAAALWWAGAQAPSSIDIDDGISQLLLMLRGDDGERHTWLLDISTDLGVPVVAALSCDKDRRNLVIGLGAGTDADGAQRRAVLELCQMEIGLQLARLKPEAQRLDDDRRHLARAEMDIGDARLHGRGRSKASAVAGDEHDAFDAVVDIFRTHRIDVTLIDLTRADIGVSVVKAVAPDLQPSPGSIQTARLKGRLRAGVRLPVVPLH